MFRDIWQGVKWVFRGVAEFYRHPRLWRFIAAPLVLVLVIYGWLFYATLMVWMPQMLTAVREFFADTWFEFLGSWVGFFIKLGCYLGLGVLTAFFAGNVFEVLGGFCFSRMVRDYEIRILHREVVDLPISVQMRNLAERGLFSLVTIILYAALFIAGFFVPWIVPPVMMVLIGYRYAVIYASEAVFYSGHRLDEIGILYRKRSGLLYGFGSMAFLIFLLPLLPIFLIPGLVIGGTLMYHHRKD